MMSQPRQLGGADLAFEIRGVSTCPRGAVESRSTLQAQKNPETLTAILGAVGRVYG